MGLGRPKLDCANPCRYPYAHITQDVELECLLGGRIGDGFEMPKKTGQKYELPMETAAQLMQRRPVLSQKPHGLLLVVSLLENSSLSEMQTFKQFYQKICDRGMPSLSIARLSKLAKRGFLGIQPIVVLTKPDLIGRQEMQVTERTLEDVLDNGEIDQSIDIFCANTGIARDYTFPVRNYLGPYNERNHVLEKLAMNALAASVKNALEKVNRELQFRIRILDAATEQQIGESDIQLEKGDFEEGVARLRSLAKNMNC